MSARPDYEVVLIHPGRYFTAEWYYTAEGRMPALEYYNALGVLDQDRFDDLIRYFCETKPGILLPKTLYRIEEPVHKIYALKARDERFFNFTTVDARIIVTNAYHKHSQKMTKGDLDCLQAPTMKNKGKSRGLLARKMDDPAYRKRHEESFELLKLEVQLLDALERKHWTYADLARAMHTQKSAVSRDLKGGGLRSASMARIAKMAEVLGLRLFSFCVAEDKAGQVLPVLRKLVTA